MWPFGGMSASPPPQPVEGVTPRTSRPPLGASRSILKGRHGAEGKGVVWWGHPKAPPAAAQSTCQHHRRRVDGNKASPAGTNHLARYMGEPHALQPPVGGYGGHRRGAQLGVNVPQVPGAQARAAAAILNAPCAPTTPAPAIAAAAATAVTAVAAPFPFTPCRATADRLRGGRAADATLRRSEQAVRKGGHSGAHMPPHFRRGQSGPPPTPAHPRRRHPATAAVAAAAVEGT